MSSEEILCSASKTSFQQSFVEAYQQALLGVNIEAALLSGTWLASARRVFHEEGAVRIPRIFSRPTFQALQHEAERLCPHELHRDFLMPGYDTPRRMSVCGGRTLLANSPFLSMLYFHRELRFLVQEIVGAPINSVPHPEEFMVLNRLRGEGQTHGWHLDDPQFALIIIVETPPHECGGFVELVPNWSTFTNTHALDMTSDLSKALSLASELGFVRRLYLESGDAYLLNAGECLHRIAPIVGAHACRCVVNMAFDKRLQPCFGVTANLLYAADA